MKTWGVVTKAGVGSLRRWPVVARDLPESLQHSLLVLVLITAACGHPERPAHVDAGANSINLPPPAPPAIATASGTACAVHPDGALWCWGGSAVFVGDSPGPSQFGAPTRWSNFDPWSGCGITEAGELLCPAQPSGSENQVWSAVWGSRENQNCALRQDGSLWCWSACGTSTPMTRVTDATWKAVSLSDGSAAFGIQSDGSLWSWNNPRCGASPDTPKEIDSGPWLSVSGSMLNVCGILDDHSLYCAWNGEGFSLMGTDSDWAAVSIENDDGSNGCATKTDGSLWCWGQNSSGDLGDGTTEHSLTPVQIGAGRHWLAVSVQSEFACAVTTEGQNFCWGSNEYGETGQGTTAEVMNPVPVSAGSTWSSIAAGMSSVCGIQRDGSLWCWGLNDGNELGETSDDASQVPETFPLPGPWLQVSQLDSTLCAVRGDHSLWCWGYLPCLSNVQCSDGSLGLIQVGTATSWASVSVGSNDVCGVQQDGSLWCWGVNAAGEVGNGTTVPQSVPIQVGTARWQMVDMGTEHACGLQEDGSLWCWGTNTFGQLGDGTTTDQSVPERIGTDTDWVQIRSSCGLKSSGALWCWGIPEKLTPALVTTDGAQTWSTVGRADLTSNGEAAGAPPELSACAVKSDGTLWCVENDQAFSQIGTSTDWSSASAGFASCGIKMDGSLWCWGNNARGGVGNGQAFLTTPTPVKD